MSWKSTATAAVESITTYFCYAVIFTNRENVFVDIQPQRIPPGYRKLKHKWFTEKYIDSRTRHERSGIMLHKRGFGIYDGLGDDRRQESVPCVLGSKIPNIGYIIKMFRNKRINGQRNSYVVNG